MHELLPHPSDIGFRATGPDLAAALSSAVAGLAAATTGSGDVTDTETRPVDLEADDLESLVVTLLDECLYLLDADGWLATAADLTVDGLRVHGVLRGETFDPERYPDGVHVKAITWHGLEVRLDDGAQLTVYVDI